jgi:hypothetical protein
MHLDEIAFHVAPGGRMPCCFSIKPDGMALPNWSFHLSSR